MKKSLEYFRREIGRIEKFGIFLINRRTKQMDTEYGTPTLERCATLINSVVTEPASWWGRVCDLQRLIAYYAELTCSMFDFTVSPVLLGSNLTTLVVRNPHLRRAPHTFYKYMYIIIKYFIN